MGLLQASCDATSKALPVDLASLTRLVRVLRASRDVEAVDGRSLVEDVIARIRRESSGAGPPGT